MSAITALSIQFEPASVQFSNALLMAPGRISGSAAMLVTVVAITCGASMAA